MQKGPANDLETLQAALARAEARARRERAARLEAEKILDQKSTELFAVTARLYSANAELEVQLAEYERSRAEAWRLANVDPATGVASRSWFERQLDAAFDAAIRDGARAALMMIDIDRIRNMNETFGAHAGDAIIEQTAGRLSRLTPSDWRVARYSGDRFALLSTAAPHDERDLSDEAARLCDAVLLAFEEPCLIDGCCVRISLSMGVAIAPDDAATAAELKRCADLALMTAKRSKDGRVARFERAMLASADARRSVVSALPGALEDGLIEVWHQPKIFIDSGAVAGVEALARWRRECGAVTGPDVFMPIAEESALIVDLGRLVLRNALADLGRWRDRGLCRSVAVNVSPVQLQTARFAEEVIEALELSGQPPSALQIEVTETAIVSDYAAAASALGRLKEIGVSIALDDFGAGYATHSLLRDLPVDTIKIDRSFVAQVGKSAFAERVVDNILQLSRSLGLAVVAEGVELASHLTFLQTRDCQIGQGFLWARPMPFDACTAWLAERNVVAQSAAS